LLLHCVFARQFWYCLLQRVGLATLAPHLAELSFIDWWREASSSISSITARGLSSVIILGAWTLWWHKIACLFDGGTLSLSAALAMAGEELWFWSVTGVTELSMLTGVDRGGGGGWLVGLCSCGSTPALYRRACLALACPSG
jgi:hypothetical protein